MINLNSPSQCCGCGACAQICPRGCIAMQKDAEGFLYPVIDKVKCVNCSACNQVCPFLRTDHSSDPLTVFASYNKDENIRRESSSGGVFSAIAKKVIEGKGIVYGVVLSEDCKYARYASASSMEELQKMRGAKYVQAQTELVFSRIREQLKQGKQILFSGTPCHVNGLKSFLKIEYPKLLCVDVVCHGVPSPELWSKYVNEQEHRYSTKFEKINFRDKTNGWLGYGMAKIGSDGKLIYTKKEYDPFLQLFYKDICLRPSCYACKAKECRLSDLTIGDFWGVERVVPDMFDGFGTTLLIIRTQAGQKVIDAIKNQLRLESASYEEAILFNSSEISSCHQVPQRKEFFSDMNRLSVKQLDRKYNPRSFKGKVKKFLYEIGVLNFLKKIFNR